MRGTFGQQGRTSKTHCSTVDTPQIFRVSFSNQISPNLTLFALFFESDPHVQALQTLDTIMMKDPTQKNHFYRNTLQESLPYIPKVSFNSEIYSKLG